jgi:hypothetical protein
MTEARSAEQIATSTRYNAVGAIVAGLLFAAGTAGEIVGATSGNIDNILLGAMGIVSGEEIGRITLQQVFTNLRELVPGHASTQQPELPCPVEQDI